MEVKYIWSSMFRLSTILYICCRYALVANVLYLLAIAKQLGARVIFPTVFALVRSHVIHFFSTLVSFESHPVERASSRVFLVAIHGTKSSRR